MNTDNAPAKEVLAEIARCAMHWVGEARLIGNVRAIDIVRAVEATFDEIAALKAEIEQLRRELDKARRVEAAADSTYTHWRARALAAEAREAALRETIAEAVQFYDNLDRPHDPGEPELLDRLAALAQPKEGQADAQP